MHQYSKLDKEPTAWCQDVQSIRACGANVLIHVNCRINGYRRPRTFSARTRNKRHELGQLARNDERACDYGSD